MKFGLFLLAHSAEKAPAAEVYRNLLEQARLADRLGFAVVWLAEHHFSSYGYGPNPLLTALKVADATEHVRVGTAVIVLPLHNPLYVAEQIAQVDQFTGGRLEVGFGSGYQEYEFSRWGVPLSEKGERFSEALEIVRRALTDRTLSHEGKYYHFPETTLFPEPFQKPTPPLWVAVQRPEAIAWAVRGGYQCISGGSSAPSDRLEASWVAFRDGVNAAGMPWPREFAIQAQVYVGESEEDAREQLHHAIWHLRMTGPLHNNTQVVEDGRILEFPQAGEPSLDALYDRYVFFGTADRVAERLDGLLATTGVTYLNCVMAMGRLEHHKVMASMERFATQVAPRFAGRVGTAPTAVPVTAG